MPTIGELVGYLRLNTSDFKRGADDAERSSKSLAQKLSGSMSGVGQSIAIGLTLPLTLVAKKIFDVGSTYETAMNVFQAATRATAAEMATAARVAEGLGNDMKLPGVSAGDAAIAMTEMGKAGLSAAQSMESARGVLELSTAATISAGEAAKITGNALNAFGLAASESGRVADLLAASASATSAEITDVAAALQQSSASAAALKIPLDDLVTSISLMAAAGIKGSDAGTSLKTFMAALTPSTKEAAGAMKALGIDAFNAKGEFVGLEAVIKQAAPALAKMTDEQRAYAVEAAFGSDAQRAANVILGAGVEKFREMDVTVNKAGAAFEMSSAKSKGLSGSVEGLTSSLETLGISIFKSVAPGLENMVRGLADMVTTLAGASPKVLQFGTVALGVFAAAGPLALGIGKIIELMTSLGPRGIAVSAAIAGVAALAAAYTTNFSGMKNTIDSFFHDYSAGIDGANKKSAAFGGEAGAVFGKIGIMFAQGLDAVFHTVKQFIGILGTLDTVINDVFKGDWGKIGQHWNEGMATLERSDQAFRERLNNRAFEFRTGYAAEWGKTGNEAAVALFGGTQKGLEANPPGLLLKDALLKYKGPTIEAARSLGQAAGSTAGKNAVQSWFDATHHSPFFIVHEFEQAVTDSMKAANSFEKVGFTAGTKLKLGFDASGVKKAYREAAKEIVDSINQVFRDAKVDELLAAKIKPTVDTLITKSKQLRETIVPIYTDIGGAATKSAHDIGIGHQQIIDAWQLSERIADEEAAAIARHAKEMADATLREAQRVHDGLIDAYQDAARRVPQFVKDIADGVANASGKLGDDVLKMSTKVQGAIGSIIGVVTTLPLPFAESARKILATVDQWFQWGDQVLELLNRLGLNVPANMSQLVEKIVSHFKDGFGRVLESLKGFGQSLLGGLKDILSKAGSLFQGGLGQSLGIGLGGAGILGGLKLGGFGGSVLTGAGIGAIAGSIIPGLGTLFGAGVGAIGGAIVGGIKKLFGGGGKSVAEKTAEEQMKLQTEGLRLGVEKGKQDLQQAIAKTASDVHNLIDQFGAGARVPKEVIKNAVKDIAFTLKQLAKELSKIAAEATPELAAAMERYKGVVEIGAAAPLALEMISRHIPTGEKAISNFVFDWSRIVTAFGEAAMEIPNKLEKQAAKLATRTGPVAEFIKNTLEALVGFFNVKKVQQSDVDTFVGNTEMIVGGLAGAADRLDKYGVKQAAILSERGTVIFTFLTGYAEQQRSMVDLPLPSETDYSNLFTGLGTGLTKAVSFAVGFVKEGLQEAVAFFDIAKELYSGITGGLDVLKAVAEAKMVEVSQWDVFVNGIAGMKDAVSRAAGLMHDALGISVGLRTDSEQTRDNVLAAIAAINQMGAAAAGAIGNAAASLPQGGAGSFGTQSLGTLSLAPAGGPGFGLSSAGSASGGIHVTLQPGAVVLNGESPNDPRFDDKLARAVARGIKSGLYRKTVFND